MTTDQSDSIDILQQSLEQTADTFGSAAKLLRLNKEISNYENLLQEKVNESKKLQKEFILDSFHVNRLHKSYKDWENKENDAFMGGEIKGYNYKLGKMSRLNFETEKLDKEYEGLREKVKLPACLLSIRTIKKYNDGALLRYILKNADGEFPSSIDISELFSLDPQSELPPPDFKVFNRLLNIEFRLRIQRKVKYEILLSVKQQLTAKNKKWSSRDSDLNYFMTTKLADIMSEVEKVRKSEYEDLKDYDYYNDEDDEEEQEEQEEELDIEQEIDEEATVVEDEDALGERDSENYDYVDNGNDGEDDIENSDGDEDPVGNGQKDVADDQESDFENIDDKNPEARLDSKVNSLDATESPHAFGEADSDLAIDDEMNIDG